MTGEWPKNQIDHKNGIRNDNRWCNLRESTQSENTENNTFYKNNKSGYRGVSYDNKAKKWASNISVRRKKIFLGYYNTPEEASKTYLEAKVKYHQFQPIPRENF